MNANQLFLTGIALLLSSSLGFAQDVKEEQKQDSTKKKSVDITFDLGKHDEQKERDGSTVRYPRTYWGFTFTRMDWGFSRLSDDGSFTLDEENKFLSYKKASNFGFDVAQFGVRFNDHFKMYLSTGFEWNFWRLKNDVQLLQDVSPLSYEDLDPEGKYKKNILTSTYLRLPLTFELRSRQLKSDNRIKFAFGLMTGVLLKGTQRFKSEKYGKQKFKDTYNLQTFQYGPFFRIGYDEFGLFAKYYMNDLFEKSPDQKGLRNIAFGVTFGF